MTREILGRALRGDRFEDLRIVDCHCHLGPTSGFYHPRSDIDDLMGHASICGVERLCIAPHVAISCDCGMGNDMAANAASRYPGKALGLLVPNGNRPEDVDAEFARHYHTGRFAGVKVHPGGIQTRLTAPGYLKAFEIVSRDGGYVLSHTWDECPYSAIELCEEVIRAFPGVPFILGHAGGTQAGMDKAAAVVNRYPNAYLDTCGAEYSNTWIEEVARRVDHAKILYGSDAPYHDIRYSLSRILFADLDDGLKARILSENYDRMVSSHPLRQVQTAQEEAEL